jgi:hypothetical protein
METYVLLPETEYNRRCKPDSPNLDSMIKNTLNEPHKGPEEKANAINNAVSKFLRKKHSLEDSHDGRQIKRRRENRENSFEFPEPRPQRRDPSFEYPEPPARKREASYEYPNPASRKRQASYEYPEPSTRKRESSYEYPTPHKQPEPDRVLRTKIKKNRPMPYPKRKPLRQESIECSPEPQEGGWLSYG